MLTFVLKQLRYLLVFVLIEMKLLRLQCDLRGQVSQLLQSTHLVNQAPTALELQII